MRHLPALFLAVATSPAFAANFATCILDKMPGVANDVAANAVYRVCVDKHPGDVEQGAGRGFFGYANGAECITAKAKDTRSARAAQIIGFACRKLYDESEITHFLRQEPKLRPFTGKLDGE